MTPDRRVAEMHEDSFSTAHPPPWFLLGSLLLLIIALILLAAVLGDRVYAANETTSVLALILFAFAAAAALHLRSWHAGRKAVQETEREFTSVFQHALDAILILDDQGVCLDANPAAFVLLGAPRAVLVGHSFAQFYPASDEFAGHWQSFLKRTYQRGRMQLFRPNGSRVIVQFNVAANFLPGRHVVILCDTTERVENQDSLRQSNELLEQMADNIREIFWMLDASTKKVLKVSRAYETITGHSLESIASDPMSYVDLIHPDDRVWVLARIEEAVHSGHLSEEFRIVRPGGEVRWVSVNGETVSDDGPAVRHLVGTAQDITGRKLAEAQVVLHLATAEAAREKAEASRAEAEALRKATLALTQNLRMDVVLDTLLLCVLEIIPYDSASVILTESDGRLFVARESPQAPLNRRVVTLDAGQNAFLQRVLLLKKSTHLWDTGEEADWSETRALANIRCWIGVPLIVGDCVLGLLSIGNLQPRTLTTEHFRLAKSLAVPASVAIHNARLYEWAEIYAAERRQLLEQADAVQDSKAGRSRLPLV